MWGAGVWVPDWPSACSKLGGKGVHLQRQQTPMKQRDKDAVQAVPIPVIQHAIGHAIVSEA